MKILCPLLLLLACLPLWAAETKPREAKGVSGHLPPKWNSLLQPVPAGSAEPTHGLITCDLSGRDLHFLTSAIENGQIQLWLCEIARKKAETEQIRTVAVALQDVETMEHSFVTQLAKRKGLVISPLSVSATQKKLAQEFAALTGPRFDKAVIEQMLQTAQEAVASFESATQSSDAEIKAVAEQLLPVAKDHLLLAGRVAGRSPETNTKPGFRNTAPAVPERSPEREVEMETPPPVADRAMLRSTPPPRPEGPRPIPPLLQPGR